MKNLKKVTAGFLSLSLLTCVGATQAFADSPITASGGTDTKDATVGTVKTAEKIYNVEIAWGDFQYDCVEKWNTTEFKYTHEWTRHTTHSTEKNTEDSDKITITNKSNIAINAQFGFAPEKTKYSGVSGKFYNDSGYGTPLNTGDDNDTTQLESAVGGSKSDDVYMKLVGDSTSTPTNNDTIGTVTVTVSERTSS